MSGPLHNPFIDKENYINFATTELSYVIEKQKGDVTLLKKTIDHYYCRIEEEINQ